MDKDERVSFSPAEKYRGYAKSRKRSLFRSQAAHFNSRTAFLNFVHALRVDKPPPTLYCRQRRPCGNYDLNDSVSFGEIAAELALTSHPEDSDAESDANDSESAEESDDEDGPSAS